MAEAHGHLRSAVDAGHGVILRIPAQCQGLFNDRRKVLVFSDMGHAGIGHHARREHTVPVAVLYRHQAVGGEQQRGRDVGEFLLLILPRRAEIALELRICLQLRIGVSRKHFSVGIYVDALVLGLLKQLVQIMQVVSRDHDKGTLFDRQRHLGRNRRAVGFRVGAVQQRHAAQVYLSGFKHQGEQFFRAQIPADGGKSAPEEAVDFRIGIAQGQGVIGISGHPAQAQQNQGFQGADVLIAVP